MTSPIIVIILLLIFLLSFIGWMLSFYFYGVYRKFIPDVVFWIPSFLQMAKCRCRDIVDTPYGKILGQSNSFWGMFYYAAMMGLAMGIFFHKPIPLWVPLMLSSLGFIFSLYLVRGLYILNVICRTCYGVHVVNVLVFLMTLLLFLLV